MMTFFIFCKIARKISLVIVLAAAVITTGSFYSCKNEKKLTVLYGYSFEQAIDTARETGKMLCVVLSSPDCQPCIKYVQIASDHYKHLASKVLFNIVDVQEPEHQWYSHWLCLGALPSTCVFSPKGELKAVVSGTSSASMQCVEAAINGNTKCTAYFYAEYFSVQGDLYSTLNDLLLCKRNLEQGKDISKDIDACLSRTNYPYPVYLKCLNEEQQERHQEAAQWANRFLAFDNSIYFHVYNDLYRIMKSIVNPNYTPDDDAVLLVTNELRLDNCQLHQPTHFTLTLTNTGKAPLTVHNIGMSCSCLTLMSEKKQHLLPGQSTQVNFVFTPDAQGDIVREVTFTSDAANLIERVIIRALVK